MRRVFILCLTCETHRGGILCTKRSPIICGELKLTAVAQFHVYSTVKSILYIR